MEQKQVYNECTCCNQPLTKEEILRNKEHENYYYTICNKCVDRATDRLIKIAYQ